MKRYVLVVEVEDHKDFAKDIKKMVGEDGNVECRGYAYYDRLVSVREDK